MDYKQQREHLVKGLVGNRRKQYTTDAGFKATIETLAHLLPFMIDGLSAQADKEAESRNLAFVKMMTETMTSHLDRMPGEL